MPYFLLKISHRDGKGYIIEMDWVCKRLFFIFDDFSNSKLTTMPNRGSVRGERNSLAFLKFVNIYALICVYQFILHYLLLSNAVIFGVSWRVCVDKFPWSIPRTECFITNIWNLWLFKIKLANNLWENGKYPS